MTDDMPDVIYMVRRTTEKPGFSMMYPSLSASAESAPYALIPDGVDPADAVVVSKGAIETLGEIMEKRDARIAELKEERDSARRGRDAAVKLASTYKARAAKLEAALAHRDQQHAKLIEAVLAIPPFDDFGFCQFCNSDMPHEHDDGCPRAIAAQQRKEAQP